jgi:hypothetical protein
VSAPIEAGDPHGYVRLRDALLGFEADLVSTGHHPESRIVERAVHFYIGSPSEFLSESRTALLTTLDSAHNLPPDLAQRMRTIIAKIDEGFRAVGGA